MATKVLHEYIYDSFIISQLTAIYPNLVHIFKRFGTRRGKVDLLVIHTSPNSGSHLDLTVDKELLHRLPVSLVKSRVMHPDPKRQGQLQVWLSYSGDDIVHLTKHTDIRNPGRQKRKKNKIKTKEMEMLGRATVETNGGKRC